MFDFVIINAYLITISVGNVAFFIWNLWKANDTLDDREDLMDASAILWEVLEEVHQPVPDYDLATGKLNEAQNILYTYN